MFSRHHLLAWGLFFEMKKPAEAARFFDSSKRDIE
jgi:hypothetical protein